MTRIKQIWAFFLALEIKFVVVTKHINLIISFKKMKSVNPWLIFFYYFAENQTEL
jgi:hypothetical protein